MDVLQNILDTSSHAIFTVDREGIVTHINQQAKEHFGLSNRSRESHPAGRLQQGDTVILATTSLGRDDGNLSPEDLKCIGIQDSKIRRGDMLIAVGVYGEGYIKPVYKYLHSGSDMMHFSTVFQGIPIQVDIENKTVSVSVNGKKYAIEYFICIGQLVVLSWQTHQVKFWEDKGYSARKEGIGELLRRGSFMAKVKGAEVRVVGYHFLDFFEGGKFEQHLQDVNSGAVDYYAPQEYEINGYALSASLLPIKDEAGRVGGVIVKFRNIEDIRVTITERNMAIQAAERQYREAERAVSGDGDLLGLFGSNTAMANVRRTMQKLSGLDCPILIVGESGTGKTRTAHRIAEVSPRGKKPVTVDCSVIPQEQLAQTLFGDGGAVYQAQGGFLLLEEISRLPAELQSRLLHLMQYKELRLANGDTVPADVRVIATTAQDLHRLMQDGSFRADIYYYLNAFSISLPSLRNCKEAIPLIISDLIERFREKYKSPEKNLSGEAFGRLLTYDWPGNIRELEQVLERAVLMSDTDIIYPEHIQLEESPAGMTLREQLRQVEIEIIRHTLVQCGGDRKRAQELLGLSRSVFYDKMKEYGIR